ncbi:MAG: DoxX family protein [Planctomycetes bacterium]|nr:DoxX family protein [Planctomycetota bacterium]
MFNHPSPPPSTTTRAGLVVHVARFATALILLQTLWFKFTGAPESVWIFQQLGLEPVGRIGSGIAELVAAVLLVWPRRAVAAAGAVLTLGVISGAIVSHLTVLGIEVQGDGGTLFVLALIVLAGAAWTAWSWRVELLRAVRALAAQRAGRRPGSEVPSSRS